MSFVAEAEGSLVRVKRSDSCELSIASSIHKCFKGPLEMGDRSLAVVPRQVADTAHWRASDGGVVPMMVVDMQPSSKPPIPLAF